MLYKSENVTVELFGESHSKFIGVNIYGLKKGEIISIEKIKEILKRRKGIKGLSTDRNEPEDLCFFGIDKSGKINSDVVTFKIENKDVKTEDYEKINGIIRPSTIDYVSYIKYGKIISGSGKFSGRLTAPLCIAGSIFKQLLEKKGVKIYSHVYSVGEIYDDEFNANNFNKAENKPLNVINDIKGEEIINYVKKVKEDGDSLGGIIECAVLGLDAGVGDAYFDGLESKISQAVFGIPAVKGIEFGSGFKASKKLGSHNNDILIYNDNKIEYKSNNDGGIVGGISNGNPIIIKVAFKPVPSIKKEQESIDVNLKKNVKLKIEGRHDVCIPLRACPIIESAVAMSIFGEIFNKEESLDSYRALINNIDNGIAELLDKRKRVTEKVKQFKIKNGIKRKDSKREKEIIESLTTRHKNVEKEIKDVYRKILKNSKK